MRAEWLTAFRPPCSAAVCWRAVLFVDSIADRLFLGLPGFGPFGGTVLSGKKLTRARTAVLNYIQQLVTFLSTHFRRGPHDQGERRFGKVARRTRSSAEAPIIFRIVAFTVEMMFDGLSVAAAHIIALDPAFGPAVCNENSDSGVPAMKPPTRAQTRAHPAVLAESWTNPDPETISTHRRGRAHSERGDPGTSGSIAGNLIRCLDRLGAGEQTASVESRSIP